MDISGYCCYGTPFEEMEEGDGVSKKPLAVENQVVTDEKGRRRFHGAFTGGFSAGYFNTVGTKEGWVPSNFVSSRTSRFAAKKESLPEDFMDKEDLGEHGIAPRQIKTTSYFTEHDLISESGPQGRETRIWDHTELAAETEKLADLLRPVSDSIGVVLLKKMGWRPGKGIGPLVTKPNLDAEKKIYGCPLPPGLADTAGPQDENQLCSEKGHKVSAEDIDVHMFEPKTDIHGLGYKGLMTDDILSERRVLKTTQFQQSKSRKGIIGQAFGVGAFEEEDVDIYSVEDLSKYDFSIGFHPSAKNNKAGLVTEEFVLGIVKVQRKFYPPPKVPRDFKPEHVPFHEGAPSTADNGERRSWPKKVAPTLESTIVQWDESSSVFSLMKQADRDRLLKLKAALETKDSPQKPAATGVEPKKGNSKTPEPTPNLPLAPFVDSKVFHGDHRLEELYKEFVNYLKRGLLMPVPPGITEWEWESYKAEFAKLVPDDLQQNVELTKHGSKPLASARVSSIYGKILRAKFTHGDQDEDEESERRVGGDEDLLKAVQMKMFGAMTRQKYTWHPDKLLCRRFNVPNPYPDSNFVGIPELRKSSKSSMLLDFDRLSMPERRMQEKAPAESDEEFPAKLKEREPSPSPSASTDTTHGKPTSSSVEARPEDLGSVQVEEERPPMDLFKVIFASSESESESEAEGEGTVAADQDTGQPTPSADTKEDVALRISRGSLKVELPSVRAEEVPPGDAGDVTTNDESPDLVRAMNPDSRRMPESLERTSLVSISQETNLATFNQFLPSCDLTYGPALPPESSVSPELPPWSVVRHERHKSKKHSKKHEKHHKWKHSSSSKRHRSRDCR